MNLAIELNEKERDLVSRIDFDPGAGSYNRDSWQPIIASLLGMQICVS
jgi:hypothetical protein